MHTRALQGTPLSERAEQQNLTMQMLKMAAYLAAAKSAEFGVLSALSVVTAFKMNANSQSCHSSVPLYNRDTLKM